jgi:hypothetical protein
MYYILKFSEKIAEAKTNGEVYLRVAANTIDPTDWSRSVPYQLMQFANFAMDPNGRMIKSRDPDSNREMRIELTEKGKHAPIVFKEDIPHNF